MKTIFVFYIPITLLLCFVENGASGSLYGANGKDRAFQRSVIYDYSVSRKLFLIHTVRRHERQHYARFKDTVIMFPDYLPLILAHDEIHMGDPHLVER